MMGACFAVGDVPFVNSCAASTVSLFAIFFFFRSLARHMSHLTWTGLSASKKRGFTKRHITHRICAAKLTEHEDIKTTPCSVWSQVPTPRGNGGTRPLCCDRKRQQPGGGDRVASLTTRNSQVGHVSTPRRSSAKSWRSWARGTGSVFRRF